MKNLEIIGLDESKVNKVKDALAQLLADYQIYYTNLRNWSISRISFLRSVPLLIWQVMLMMMLQQT